MAKRFSFYFIPIIIAFGLVTYVNSFYNNFVWDDHYLIFKNHFIHQANVLKIFTHDIDQSGFSKTLFYRPLQNLSYVMDYRLWGFNPLGYHLTNTFLHILNAVLIFFLVGKIAGEKILAFLTSLFFVSHPIHYGAVTYLSGRADSLFGLFFLVSFLAFIKYRENPIRRFLLISTASFTLALLSKEMAIITIFIFMLYDGIYKKKPTRLDSVQPRRLKRFLLPYIACGAILLIYGIFRLSHLRESVVSTFPGGSLYTHLLTFPLIVGQYIVSLLLPVDLCMRKSMSLPQGFFEPQVAASILFFIFLGILGFSLKSKKKEISFFIFYFIIALLPVSNIFVKIKAIRADHWLYMPSIGFFFLLGYCINSIFAKVLRRNRERAVLIVGMLLAAVYSSITIRENLYWKDDLTLFTETLRRKPDDPLVMANLGMVYLEKGDLQKALGVEKKLAAMFPACVEGKHNLGIIYFRMGNFDKARVLFQKTILKDPTLAAPHIYMGLIYERENKPAAAETEFQKFIELSPYSELGYFSMGVLKYKKNELDEATGFFNTAIEKNPGSANTYLYLSSVYRRKNNPKEALRLLEKAARLDPRNTDILMDLGNAYNNFGLFDRAIDCFRKALVIAPKKSAAYYNMGISYQLKGDILTARRYWYRARELNPDFKEASERLEETK